MAPVIAPARSGREGREVRDFGEGRKAFQERTGTRHFRQDGLDCGAGPPGETAEDFASVRGGHRFGNRMGRRQTTRMPLAPRRS